MTELTIPTLEVRVQSCDAEVWINGIPITLLRFDDCEAAAVPVAQFMVRGQNRLLLAVNPGPAPGTWRQGPQWTAPEEARAEARVVSYPPGVFPGDHRGVQRLGLAWSGDGQEAGTRLAEATVDWPDDAWPAPVATWAWQTAGPLDPVADRAALEQFMARVHRALSESDAAFMVNLGATHLREVSAAYHQDPALEQQTIAQLFQAQFAVDGWQMEPLAPDQHDLRSCAGGRLVECARLDRRPALRSLPDAEGDGYAYPMLVGNIGGQLQVLR